MSDAKEQNARSRAILAAYYLYDMAEAANCEAYKTARLAARNARKAAIAAADETYWAASIARKRASHDNATPHPCGPDCCAYCGDAPPNLYAYEANPRRYCNATCRDRDVKSDAHATKASKP